VAPLLCHYVKVTSSALFSAIPGHCVESCGLHYVLICCIVCTCVHAIVIVSVLSHAKHVKLLSPESRVFKEIAEQQFPLSVFLVEALPYFRQRLRSLGSLFSRHCHRCRSREFGGSSCKQRVVIC